jgi:hypothetical protein
MDDFTVVCAVDHRYLEQMKLTLQTWLKHKPSIFKRPWLMFYNHEYLKDPTEVERIVDPHMKKSLRLIAWPPPGITYGGNPDVKWYHPQRNKMLAGFVYIPAMYVKTAYWLKIDVDIVANGKFDGDYYQNVLEREEPLASDDWINPKWIDVKEGAVITAPPWAYTKPADQMVLLDRWVEKYAEQLPELASKEPLNLIPGPCDKCGKHLDCQCKPIWDRVVMHGKPRRICSWCAFFETEFSKYCAQAASTVGEFQIPVPSQDGFTWYIAARLGLKMNFVHMKKLGWRICSSMRNISKAVEESMNGTTSPS